VASVDGLVRGDAGRSISRLAAITLTREALHHGGRMLQLALIPPTIYYCPSHQPSSGRVERCCAASIIRQVAPHVSLVVGGTTARRSMARRTAIYAALALETLSWSTRRSR